jgi:di/tricarboxylate transporter
MAAGLRATVILVCAGVLAVVLHMAQVPQVMARSLPLVVMSIGFWAFAVLPEALTGLLFMLGAVTLAGIAPSVVFSGFTTTAFWLIFSGMILSACATKSGLSQWLTARFVGDRFVGAEYGARIASIVIFAALLALILPSTLARVVILVPLIVALCDRVGYGAHSRGRTGMVLAAAIGTYIVPITFLPANLPNIILAGSLESLYGIAPSFGSYLALHFPVIGTIKGAALVVILTVLFREPPDTANRGDAAPPRDLGGAGARLLAVMVVTLALWSLDFLHGVPPAWVGLAAAVLCLMPFMKILDIKAMPFDTAFLMLLYLAAVLAIGGVMRESGAGELLSRGLVENLPLAESGNFLRLTLLAGVAMVTGVATTMPVAPAMTAPFFGDIAAITGWSVEAVGMSQVLGYATPLLPYQLPPLMLAIAMTGIAMYDATRVLLILAVVTTPFVLPAAHLWWQVLGWY